MGTHISTIVIAPSRDVQAVATILVLDDVVTVACKSSHAHATHTTTLNTGYA